MIRYLKVLLGAALALTAFGALSASAHAAEERFHCSVEPCTLTLREDGTSGTKTAHQVFEVTDGANTISFTCSQLLGYATSQFKTTTQIAFTNLQYKECGSLSIKMNNCTYNVLGAPEKRGSPDVSVGHVTVTLPGSGGHSPPSFSIAREINASGV